MIKCQSCRSKDVELLTRWERCRGWLFYRMNHALFPDDFEDLKSQKYTQGFSDGNVAIHEKKSIEERLRNLDI